MACISVKNNKFNSKKRPLEEPADDENEELRASPRTPVSQKRQKNEGSPFCDSAKSSVEQVSFSDSINSPDNSRHPQDVTDVRTVRRQPHEPVDYGIEKKPKGLMNERDMEEKNRIKKRLALMADGETGSNRARRVMNRLKELSKAEGRIEEQYLWNEVSSSWEMSDLVYFLGMVDSTTEDIKAAGKKAGNGAKLLQEAFKLIKDARALLHSALTKQDS